MNKWVLIWLSFMSVFILAGCSTTATQTDLSIADLHFPERDGVYDRVAFGGSAKGRIELLDNCIVLNDGYSKNILIWDKQTDVQKVGGTIVITHPQFSTLKLGQKVEISGSGVSGWYDPYGPKGYKELPLKQTPVYTCKPNGYLWVFEW